MSKWLNVSRNSLTRDSRMILGFLKITTELLLEHSVSISPCSTKSVVNNIDEALVMLQTRAREVLQADRR